MNESTQGVVGKRIYWLSAIFAAVIIALLIQLWILQVVHYDTYKAKSRDNRTRLVRDRAQRGRILDRNGVSLATSRPSFSVYIVPDDCPRASRTHTFSLLGKLLGLSAEDIKAKYSSRLTASFIPRKIMGNLGLEDVIRIETHKYDLPGVVIKAENIRFYPHGKTLCHLLGYVGEISLKQLKSPEFSTYMSGDTVGRSGIELTLEKYLNGEDGYRWVEVDSVGRIKRTLKSPAPRLAKPGKDITLTIDIELQKAVESFLAPWKGAVIVSDIHTNRILALTSSPGFDPNWFASGISVENWNHLNKNPDHPLLNRAIQVMASPGSVFKIVTSTAGMETHTLNKDVVYFCNGSFKLFDTVFHCWKRGGHGTVDVVHALEGSCNVFFYQAGLKAGIDAISRAAAAYGLGHKTGIILPGEVRGFIPDRKWKKKVKNEPWWPGETISVSIGQGGVLTTPIQLLDLIVAVANKGKLLKPRIVKRIGNMEIEPEPVPGIREQIHLTAEQWRLLHEGLRAVVQGEHGTARKMHIPEFEIAGKTGTAQVISDSALKKKGLSGSDIPPKYRDHNWFAGFAPYRNPQIAILVFLENGGKTGAREKIDIARKIFMKWYELYPDRVEKRREDDS